MRKDILLSTAALLFLGACNDVKKPSEEHFTKAIDDYLSKHGDACTSIGRSLPIDVPKAEQENQYGIGPEMATLEGAGLVNSSNAVATTPGIFGPGAPRSVKRYELTGEGKKYFRQTPGIFGPSGDFCYGRKTVDKIVKWTEPMTMGAYSQTEVTYTYKIGDLASWAGHSDVQRVFPDIRATVNGISKTDQVAGLQLTNQGWEMPER